MDTNVLLPLFKTNSPLAPILEALLDNRLEVAYSNEIMLEWEEMATRLSGAAYWSKINRFVEAASRPLGPMLQIEPTFRFGVITADPDDDKFADCAIVASADFILTEDRHFAALIDSGYRPQPITPQTFIDQYLSP